MNLKTNIRLKERLHELAYAERDLTQPEEKELTELYVQLFPSLSLATAAAAFERTKTNFTVPRTNGKAKKT